jgi:hypothetical protein
MGSWASASPEDAPDGKQVGDDDDVGGGDGGEEMEVEQVGDAASGQAEECDGEPVFEVQMRGPGCLAVRFMV